MLDIKFAHLNFIANKYNTEEKIKSHLKEYRNIN